MIEPRSLAFALALTLALLCLTAATRPVLAQDTGETFQYVVQPGDTCQKLAQQFYGSEDEWARVHVHNDLGPMPHLLRPGLVLILPVPPGFKPDATLTDRRGDVAHKKPTERDWRPAQRGLDLFRAWRVNSQEDSSAEITFRDNSELQMRENTIVIIYGGTFSRARKQVYEAELETGALRTRLGQLAGGASRAKAPGGSGEETTSSTLILSTASSLATLQEANVLVEADADGTTRVANHGGQEIEVASKKPPAKRRSVKVKAGYGTRVKPRTDPEPPRPLPPAPAWAAGSPSTFLTVDTTGTLTGRWEAVPQADRYRIEIAEQETGNGVAQVIEVPATVTAFEARGLPPGDWFVTLATIDADRFEGLPSERRRLHIARVTPRSAPPDAPPPTTWQVGMQLAVPKGMTCAASPPDALSSDLVLPTPGEVTLQCSGEGANASPLPLTVLPIEVRIVGLEPDTLPLAPDVPRTLRVETDAAHLQAITPALLAPEGLLLSTPRTLRPGAWEFTLTATEDAPATTQLQVVFPIGTQRLTAQTLPLTVAGGTPVGPDGQPEPDHPWVTFGATFGWAIPLSDDALGDASYSHAPRFALSLAFNPTDALSIEAAGHLSRPTDNADDTIDTVYGLRGALAWALLDGLLRPVLTLGGGLDLTPTDTVPVVTPGLGLRVHGDTPVGFRAMLLQDLNIARSLTTGVTQLHLTLTIDL